MPPRPAKVSLPSRRGSPERPQPALVLPFPRRKRFRGRGFLLLGLAALLLLLTLCVYLLYRELETSELQARFFAKLSGEASFVLESGASSQIRFPASGPYDERLGYSRLPLIFEKLTTNGYLMAAQARASSRLLDLADRSLFPPYREKTQAGLLLLDCGEEPLFSARYPQRVYPDFDAIPPRVVEALLFIENRELLEVEHPKRNPAMEWDRFARAALDYAVHLVDADRETVGGSTLATQIEKFRHSPEGRTAGVREKLSQMLSASLRAYLDGEQTLPARRRIVLDYLNSVPLAAAPGYGEVLGLGDGLAVWYGADFDAVNRLLRGGATEHEALQAQALAYKQVLSLLIAQRRPSYYLGANHVALMDLTDSYVRLLANATIISPALQKAALAAKPRLRREDVTPETAPFVPRKAVNALRVSLAEMLAVPSLYQLDRLDLTVRSTLDGPTQQEVGKVLRQLNNPHYLKQAGLTGPKLLERGDPAGVVYSFTLYERGGDANRLRVQTDNFDQPFDVNEGAKLDLGSTAKLRTLVIYLEIIASLHQRFTATSKDALKQVELAPEDRLARWAVDYLLGGNDRDLTRMLEAAMERRYSASPGEAFFTGGGLHTFHNYQREDDGRVVSVWQATEQSINLAYIRLMRDIVRHYMYQVPGSTARVLKDTEDPAREVYLTRFADIEGQAFVHRFLHKHRNKTPEQALEALLSGVHPVPPRYATVFRSLEPQAGFEPFARFMRARLPHSDLSDAELRELYQKYGPEQFDLADRGYIARVHPLELWLVGYLRQNPGASAKQIIAASREERQAVYRWLLKTRHKNAQDIRIRTLFEVEAFVEIHRAWKKLGYPFESLTPSYATAIGSSGDRPAALAELVGIVLNDGVRLPLVRVDELHFASGTPYETVVRRSAAPGERVLAPEVARVARKALGRVVENGTGRRIHKALQRANGGFIEVGGKTGTGDHRYEVYAGRGRLLESRVMNRAATFVFFLGDRFFGTVTAYVPGPEAARYSFTSALPVQLLKTLAPALKPLVDPANENKRACAR
jgi:membrane peptidoglycan carboxypeptidase